ncbi:ISAs1 family transposase [Paractinoplanes rishiriensis]|uniref:Transposase n=1 Tax=Paractinoplanes rishiriensis TaxID=1050105 RepID=A0A919MZY9_9ACTN|nr:ISAs1 family transposase [Actinoplanes rishiriensis]GIF02144.1 hypothetical protein Ari01nite_96080 [Actinoplanes rishiriensis]
MSACTIPGLSAVTTPTGMTFCPVTEGEQAGLLHALSAVPDPRNPRGLRYPLAGLLCVAVCAVMAGATSVTAIADWLHDLDDISRARLGFRRGVPATTTMWRLLIRLDADLLATILAGWLRTRTRPDTPRRPRYRHVIAIDGKTLRGARRPDGSQVHLLSALDTSTGIVLAQVTVSAKSNEIPAFAPLLDAVELLLGSLKDLIFVADALHTQVNHATEIAARGAHLLIPAKRNQPTLHTQLKTLPWAHVPIGHQTREAGHGRRETPHRQGHHPAHTRRDRLPPRSAGDPDHPDPHHYQKRQNHPRNRVPDHLPARHRRPPQRHTTMDPRRMADRKS